MFDGFWYGIFGGLFGPALAQWLGRFKYWVIFLIATLAAFGLIFFTGITLKGLNKTVEIIFKSGFDPLFILLPIGAGLFAVFVAFLGALNNPKKDKSNDGQKK